MPKYRVTFEIDAHGTRVDEMIDYEWLTKFIGYGETIADALKKVRRIVESGNKEEC